VPCSIPRVSNVLLPFLTLFESNKTVIQAINDRFEQLDEKFFIDGVKALGRCWEKCIALEGDYVEKLLNDYARVLSLLIEQPS